MGQYLEITVDEKARERVGQIGLFGFTLHLEAPRQNIDWRAQWEKQYALWVGKTKLELLSDPLILAQHVFLRRLGVNPKDHPPAAQALIQRFLLSPSLDRFPQINPIVDSINLAAVESLLPMAAFDVEKLSPPLYLHSLTHSGELMAIGGSRITIPAGAIVLSDQERILSWFCCRDGDWQKVTSQTHSVMVLACQVEGIEKNVVIQALDCAQEFLTQAYLG